MFTNFGTPPNSAETRALVEQRLNDLRENSGVAETLTVEWRGTPLHIQVIDMPLDALYYNPGTHRIRAQRSLDTSRDTLLVSDPWTSESQDYLSHLLTIRPSEPTRRDPDFDKLKDNLEEYKQNEPGLITREGILVNGNTRCAALRELKSTTTMRVGVLPASCDWEDINALELSLQLRPDERRDYSYINRLLAIEEQRDQLHREVPAIAKVFRTTTKICERDFWVLAELRDLIRRSTTVHGVSLRLMDFEQAQEKLAELYRAYSEESKKNKERADLLKEARFTAIALDFAKTDVRFIEADFQSRYLDKNLIEEFGAPVANVQSTVTIPGLNRSVKAAGADVATARAITEKLLQAKAVEAATETATPADQSAAAKVISQYKSAFGEAITVAGRDAMLRKKRLAAPDRIAAACKDLEQSITDLVLSRGNSSLDQEAFDDALGQLHTVLGQLAVEAQRTVDLPGDGLNWLVAAVNVRK
ncbi:transcriptional regulator [Nocardia sp. alder85J]|uniref:transcriptional regulator n=1 Tax=Nocardia sp. alder85J TaxID=2862949 RepID=UPI001CD6E632|nr:transcriptional regulator [Nocardia sp. alder85J]MCX4093958.1 transcriptional regulator [Nocardia sp. alder85J]